MTKPQPDFLYFRDTDIVELFHRVKWSDILYIATKQNHILIWRKDALTPIDLHSSLVKFIAKYKPPTNMVHTHRQYLVNEDYIEKILFNRREGLGKIWLEGRQLALMSMQGPYYKKHFGNNLKNDTNRKKNPIRGNS